MARMNERRNMPCPNCNGVGFKIEIRPIQRNENGRRFVENRTVTESCRDCGGTGTVVGPPA